MNNRSARHWLIVFVCALMASCSVGICINCYGVFLMPIAEDFGVGRATIGLGATVSQICTGLFSPFAANLVTRGKLRFGAIAGLIMTGVSIFLLAIVRNLPLYFILNVFRGIGSCLFGFTPVTMVLNRWFHKRIGLATSLAISCSGATGALMTPLFNAIIQSSGWRMGFVWMALIVLLFCLPAVILFLRHDPADCGLLPYGATEAPTFTEAQRSDKQAMVWSLPAILLILLSVDVSIGSSMPQHFPGYTETLMLGSTLGALMTSAAMFGNIGAKLSLGILSDKIGVVRANICFLLLSTATFVALMVIRTEASWIWLLLSFLFGSNYGVCTVGISLLITHFVGAERYGAVYAMSSLGGNISAAVSLSLIGLSYDLSGGYMPAMLAILLTYLLSFVLILLLKSRKTAA